MNKKPLLIFLLSALLPICACNPQDNTFYNKDIPEYGIPTNVTSYQIKDTKLISDSAYFKMHGRYYHNSDMKSTFINFSNSGFEVTFIGTTLEGFFYTTKADDSINRPYLSVCIDNEYDPDKSTPISLTAGQYSNSQRRVGDYFVHEHVVLAHDLEYGEHTVRVYKKSECLVSKVAIKSVSTDGQFVPVKAKALDLKMEFYGDSVTCGYAVESPDYYEKFCTRTENSIMSYANYCANELNADVSLISCGGYPMYQSRYCENCLPNNIPDMVSLADVEYYTANKHVWNNSSYIPDVVVIALGANDGSKVDYSSEEKVKSFTANYKQAYKTFINKLQTLYPETLIVVSDEILPIGGNFVEAMDQIVNEYNSPKIIRAKYNAYEEAEDKNLPGEGHPNKEMQKLAGQELAELIKKNLSK